MKIAENDERSLFEIEKVCRENFGEFVSLVEELAAYENLTPPDNEAVIRLERDAISEPPLFEAYLGKLDGRPVGYITFYFTYSTFLAKPTLYLEDIFVLKEFRRRGLGRELFGFCRTEAKKRGCGRLDWTVLTWNKPSIKFYEKEGGKKQDWYLYRLEGEEI